MKKSIIKLSILAGIATLGMLGCKGSPDVKETKLNQEKVDVSDAKKELDKALTDSINNYEVFKAETEVKLQENERLIAAFKDRIGSEKKSVQVECNKQIATMEQQNEKLKAILEGFKQGNEDQWEQFKLDFNTQSDQLGNSISKFADENKK